MGGDAFCGANAVLCRRYREWDGFCGGGVANGEKNYHLCALKRGIRE